MKRHTLLLVLLFILPSSPPGLAQQQDGEVQQLRQQIAELERRVAALEGSSGHQPSPASAADSAALLAAAGQQLRETSSSSSASPSPTASAAPAASLLPGNLPGGATLNYTLDGYYEYNFNQPVGQVNLLRAYDVSSNSFSLNQAAVIFDLDPDVAAGRRYGARLDLQFGQATQTLQGNPANEARPDAWRNVFQAYGTWVAPLGSGLNLDFGKWASAIGLEGNYTKDQLNYSRSYFFNYLPYYHMGFRASYPVTSKLSANYWLVNGTQQTEDQNGFKDQLFGFVLQPSKSISWTVNYYYGQEHPSHTSSTACAAPLQPGLCALPVSPVPDGKLHIFDSYATWQASSRLTLAAEADYVIQRQWASAAPGRSSAPSHLDGGAAYARWQLNPRTALAVRGEYLSDASALFSNQAQALKEVTGTYKYTLHDGLDAFLEYRQDWSNRPYFYTDNPFAPSRRQQTTTLGLVWWYGGRQGSW